MNALKRAWKQVWFFKWAFLGIVLGAVVAELLSNAGVAVTMDEGILWGAVAGLVVTYSGYFLKSGKMVTKRDNPVLNYIVGVFVFLAISAVIIAIFLGIFWVISLFIR